LTELVWGIGYKKYAKAHTYIMNNPGCEFIVTNADATYPAGEGACYPGA
jgi:4-nitrophenyl phosphatase